MPVALSGLAERSHERQRRIASVSRLRRSSPSVESIRAFRYWHRIRQEYVERFARSFHFNIRRRYRSQCHALQKINTINCVGAAASRVAGVISVGA